MRNQSAYVRIDTKKEYVEISRGWPVEGHGSIGEVKALLGIVVVPLIAQTLKMFPHHKSTIVQFFRDTASALESVELER